MFYISVNGKEIYKPLDDLLVLFNPKLTLEIGKAGSLEFDIPPANPFYDSLEQLTTEVTVDMDSEEIFHGRVLSVERTFNNIRHVYCEGDLSYLIDSVQKGVQYNGTTHDLFRRIIASHNARVNAEKRFTVGTINIENRPIVLVGHSDADINVGEIDYKQIALNSIVDEWNNSFDYIQTCLIDYCGGYLRTRRVGGTIYIDLLQDFGSDSTQAIELGRNLLDLTEEISVEDVFTVLIPLGDDSLTIASVNGGSDELIDSDAVAKFGRIVRTHVFSNVTNASTLLENSKRFMAANANIPRTITVRAVDLHLINKSINPIRIGDKVEISSYVHEVNDVLTCTKIEYDLENAENNNYTFGNPKQTLTQRYREDARYEADTYGNSAISPTAANSIGKATAASAGAAGIAAAQEQEKALSAFYDTWIKDGEEPGKVSLGALYRQYYEGKEVLISQCGIDLDGKTGNVNIRSMHNQVDDYGRQIAQNEARIDIVETETSVAIENATDRINKLGDTEAQHHTEITQQVDNLGSTVGLLARDVNTIDSKTTTALANITMRTDDLESRVITTAGYISTVDGRESSHYATITAWANEAESAISLKADKVYVDGQLQAAVAQIDDLMAGRATAANLRATNILAGSISLFGEGGSVPVATLNHSHNFAVLEGTDGEITISIGGGTTNIPQKQSFNIANTKFYKDHVAAVNIRSFSLDSEAPNTDGIGYRYETGNKRFAVYVKATLDNDTSKSGGPLYVNARPAYDSGIDAGAQTAEIGSVSLGSAGQPSYSGEDQIYYANVRVTATARGRKSDNTYYTDSSFSRNISVDVTAVYNAGKAAGSESGSDDVTITSLGFDPDDEVRYSSSVNNYYVPIKTLLSNNKSRTTMLTVSGEEARNTVSVTGMQHYTQSGESTVSYNADNKTLNASIQVTLNNGNTAGSIRTVTIPASLAYDAGANDVRSNGIRLNTNWSDSSTGYIYETANKRYRVGVIDNLSNNKSFGGTIYIPAIEAYEAGVAAGASGAADVYVTGMRHYTQSGEETVSYNASTKTLNASVQATLSNGNTTGSIRTVSIPATLAYNAGYSDGESAGGGSVTCRSLGLDTNWSTSSTGYIYQPSNRRYAVRGKATLSNGITYSATMYVPDTDAYNAGVSTGTSSVTIKSIALNTSWSSSNSGYVYQSAYKRYAVNVIATANNDNYSTNTIYINATDAYNAGAASGKTVSRVSATRNSYNDWFLNSTGTAYHIPVNATVYYSDGTSSTVSAGSVSIQDVVNFLSGGSITVSSLEAESGYDGNTRSLFKVTLSDGSVHRVWANHA